jgi:hypothetical protein
MTKTSFLVLAVIALSSIVEAQRNGPAPVNVPSIEVGGIRLHLGMAKGDIAERFVGTPIMKVDEQTWQIGDNGTVQFQNGKVIFAARSWMNDSSDQIDAIFKAVSSLNRDGFSACRVLSDTPKYTERVGIDCGQKAILINRTVAGNQRVVEVSERLGEFDSDAK